MRTGHTFTRHWDLETKQHELLGVDLGEGVARRGLVLALVLLAAWTLPLLLIFGLPGVYTVSLYLSPPIVLAIYGAQRSGRTERRRNMTQWALRVRYLTLGHRPIVCGGRRAASRDEWIPLRDRWGERADIITDLPGLAPLTILFGRDRARKRTAGPDLVLNARPRVYGPDRVWQARRRFGHVKPTQKGQA
ncbi:hypothetical protein ABZ569_32230 [Streptomyces albus]|uniref:hypothetical protein n=1 Tax=Streptomyces albus TaxID=1888 RepID=UPI0033DCE4F8